MVIAKKKKDLSEVDPCSVPSAAHEEVLFVALITVYIFSQDKQSILNAAWPIGPVPN